MKKHFETGATSQTTHVSQCSTHHTGEVRNAPARAQKVRDPMGDRLAIDGGTPVRDSLLIFGAPLVGDDEIEEVVATLKSGWLSTGPRVKQFEREFKEYVGAEYAVATSSCTAALHLALIAHGVGPGDEVLVPTMSFAATANVVEHVRAKPVFIDAEPEGFNLDCDRIEECITPKTKAIMPVHFAGLPCDMDRVNEIAARRGLAVIEDAAHAAGTRYYGKRIGGLGNTTAFSFYVTKNLTTSEGGMLTTSDPDIAESSHVLGLHGMDLGAWQRYEKRGKRHYDVIAPGFKYNLPDIAAAMGIHQLRKLDRFIEIRQAFASFFNQEFQDIPELILPPDDPQHQNCWHLYPVMVRPEMLTTDRDGVRDALSAENIGSGVHFRPIHTHTFYREKYQVPPGVLKRAEFIGERVLSLPLSPALTQVDVESVVTAVRKVIAHYRR